MAEVTNTVSPHTMGDDHPWPATGTAHFTFSFVDHRSGMLAVAATPLISCPRKPGQVSSGFGSRALSVAAAVIQRRATRRGLWLMAYGFRKRISYSPGTPV